MAKGTTKGAVLKPPTAAGNNNKKKSGGRWWWWWWQRNPGAAVAALLSVGFVVVIGVWSPLGPEQFARVRCLGLIDLVWLRSVPPDSMMIDRGEVLNPDHHQWRSTNRRHRPSSATSIYTHDTHIPTHAYS
jgi:hypothetical protein